MLMTHYALAGALVGFLVGLTGVGGGALMMPLLLYLFEVVPGIAVGTDLLFAFGTKMAGTCTHHRHTQVRWSVVRRLAYGSLPGALVGLAVMAALGDQSQTAQRLITTAVAGMVVLTGVLTLAGGWVARHFAAAENRFSAVPVPTCWLVAIGFVIGVLVALTSIGAGALCAVALLWLYRDSMTAAERVGTDVAHAIPVTLVAGLGHALTGHLDLAMLGGLLLGSVPAVIVGSALTRRVPERLLHHLLGLVLLLVGAKLLW